MTTTTHPGLGAQPESVERAIAVLRGFMRVPVDSGDSFAVIDDFDGFNWALGLIDEAEISLERVLLSVCWTHPYSLLNAIRPQSRYKVSPYYETRRYLLWRLLRHFSDQPPDGVRDAMLKSLKLLIPHVDDSPGTWAYRRSVSTAYDLSGQLMPLSGVGMAVQNLLSHLPDDALIMDCLTISDSSKAIAQRELVRRAVAFRNNQPTICPVFHV